MHQLRQEQSKLYNLIQQEQELCVSLALSELGTRVWFSPRFQTTLRVDFGFSILVMCDSMSNIGMFWSCCSIDKSHSKIVNWSLFGDIGVLVWSVGPPSANIARRTFGSPWRMLCVSNVVVVRQADFFRIFVNYYFWSFSSCSISENFAQCVTFTSEVNKTRWSTSRPNLELWVWSTRMSTLLSSFHRWVYKARVAPSEILRFSDGNTIEGWPCLEYAPNIPRTTSEKNLTSFNLIVLPPPFSIMIFGTSQPRHQEEWDSGQCCRLKLASDLLLQLQFTSIRLLEGMPFWRELKTSRR